MSKNLLKNQNITFAPPFKLFNLKGESFIVSNVGIRNGSPIALSGNHNCIVTTSAVFSEICVLAKISKVVP